MHKPIRNQKFIALLLIILSLTVYLSPFLPSVHATVTALTVSPKEGFVDEIIGVNGTIETPNGNYTIFFDATKMISGVALSTGEFTTSFPVPRATNGTHTIMLQDVNTTHTATESFQVKTSYHILSPMLTPPQQLQEGDTVTILAQMLGADPNRTYQQNITVTTPANTVYYNSTLPLLTNQNGTATGTLYYPTDFQPVSANTNYTGTYQLRIYKDATTIGANSTFFVGLTNATLYHRFDWVNIKATNYTKPNENATVIIKFGNTKILSKNVTAANCTINYNWQVPVNASRGSYKVTVATAIRNGTVKNVTDAQNFTLPDPISVTILTTNLNNEPLGSVNATVYEIVQGREVQVATGLTNSSGWIVNTLERGGNYSLKAFWKYVEVNQTRVYIQSNSSWTLICQIAHIEFTVIDEKTGLPMPLIYLTLNVNFLTVTNATVIEPQQDLLTNSTGKWILRNQLVKANYTIRAYRTQLLFNTTTFTIPQNQKWFNLNIICPVLGLTVHAEDAKHASLEGYPVEIYAFAGGPYANATTGRSGDVTFSATFGIYKIRLYNIEQTIILNETYYNLINQSSLFILRSSIYHANLSVKVLDYLGQSMPNVKVKLERENAAPITINTDGNGIAFFDSITGGNCLISIYVGSDTPSETANMFVEGNTTATFTLGKYISILGIAVDTSQFAVFVTFIVVIVLFLFFMLYRRRKSKAPPEKTVAKES